MSAIIEFKFNFGGVTITQRLPGLGGFFASKAHPTTTLVINLYRKNVLMANTI